MPRRKKRPSYGYREKYAWDKDKAAERRSIRQKIKERHESRTRRGGNDTNYDDEVAEIPPTITTGKRSWSEQKDRRVAVAELFKNYLGFPQKELWYGHGGTIAKIRTIFPDISRDTVEMVLKEVVSAKHEGRMYDGVRANRRFFGEYLIQPGSIEEQLIADLMEQGKGYKKTTEFLNKTLKQQNKVIVGESAVRDAYL